MSDEEKKVIENLKTEYEKLIKEDNILFPLYKSDAKRLINLIEKQSKEIEEYKKQLDLDYVDKNFIRIDKIKAKVIEVKDRPVKDEFITASQGKLNTVIDMESLLEKE